MFSGVEFSVSSMGASPGVSGIVKESPQGDPGSPLLGRFPE